MPTGHPGKARVSSDIEHQRTDAINVIAGRRAKIRSVAAANGIPEEAIAGAILWEAVENPYLRPFPRLGPGKVHPLEINKTSAAEIVEHEGRMPALSGSELRRERVKDPDWAIEYIGAIMAHHADAYRKIASVDIRKDVAVLCTLYNTGDSEVRAAALAAHKQDARHAGKKAPMPRPNSMGLWVEQWIPFIRGLLGGDHRHRSLKSTRTSTS
jgi:hypothetical protein